MFDSSLVIKKLLLNNFPPLFASRSAYHGTTTINKRRDLRAGWKEGCFVFGTLVHLAESAFNCVPGVPPTSVTVFVTLSVVPEVMQDMCQRMRKGEIDSWGCHVVSS